MAFTLKEINVEPINTIKVNVSKLVNGGLFGYLTYFSVFSPICMSTCYVWYILTISLLPILFYPTSKELISKNKLKQKRKPNLLKLPKAVITHISKYCFVPYSFFFLSLIIVCLGTLFKDKKDLSWPLKINQEEFYWKTIN